MGTLGRPVPPLRRISGGCAVSDPRDRPGYSFNPGPPPEASRFLRNKGLRPAFSFEDVEPEEHAVAFSVAKVMELDLLDALTNAAGVGLLVNAQTKEPLLLSERWLCAWGDQLPTETVVDQVKFLKSFQIWVLP